MKMVKVFDIENNPVLIDPARVELVREYQQRSNDGKGGIIIETTVLIKVGESTVPVRSTFEEVMKLFGITEVK